MIDLSYDLLPPGDRYLPSSEDLGLSLDKIPEGFDPKKTTTPNPRDPSASMQVWCNKVAFDLAVARVVGATDWEAASNVSILMFCSNGLNSQIYLK